MTSTRLPAVGVAVGLLTATLTLSPDQAAAQSSADSASKKDYVGLWNKIDAVGWRSVASLNADGTCSNGNGRYGTWELDHNQLVMHFDAHPDWADRFGLPMRSGILKGKTSGGEPRTMTQRAMSAPAVTYAGLAGEWEYFNRDNGHRATVTLAPDGDVSEDGRVIAAWMIEGNHLFYSYVEHHDWVDSYDLPARNGVLHSSKPALTLTQQTAVTAASPAAVALQSTGVVSPATGPVQSGLTGTWNFSNATDGKRVTDTFNPDGMFLENGQPIGAWKSNGSQLSVTYKSNPEWLDTYNLPAREGVLRGTNRSGHTLTLARAGAVLPAASTVASGATGNTAPATTSMGPQGAQTGDAGYFGKTNQGMTVSDEKGGAKLALPPPVAPVLTHAAPVFGTVGSGTAAASTTPAFTPSVAATPEASDIAALTPVGKWHWHSGATHTLTDKGAILEDARVVGQWKWLDKTKGTVQVQWTGGPYRAPMTYTLSPHGNHLSGKSPASGQDHTEDRVK